MKKILSIIILLFFVVNSVFASNELSFVYINGSNNNDEKMKSWYENGVYKLHPVLKKKFLKSSAIKKYYSNIHNHSFFTSPFNNYD